MTTHHGTTDPHEIRPPWATIVDLELSPPGIPQVWYSRDVGSLAISSAYVLEDGVWRLMDGSPMIICIPEELPATRAREIAADLVAAADILEGAS